ncbi:MAG TPA: hypothetical protein VM577_18585 [Anaerovoracaceae bacterium]|nr:hypothetical protein [Anaerovoracaceae bacterium]
MSGFLTRDFSSSFFGSGRSIAVTTPITLGSCVFWVSATRGLTLGTTPLASGTTPPAVTISGNLAQVVGLRIEITTGGGRGTAIFRWSVDGGTTYTSNVLTAATVTLGTTGIVVAFPNSTYTNNNVYLGKLAAWNNRANSSTSPTQAVAANQPTLTWSDINGQHAMTFTSPQFMAFPLLVAKPCTIFAIAKTTSNGSGGYATIAAFGNAIGGAFMYAASGAGPTNNWGLYQNGDAFSGQNINTYKKITAIIRNYNDVDLRTNGSSITRTTGVSAYAVPSVIAAGNADGSQNLEGGICELVAYSRVLTTAECQIVETYLGNLYGL